MLLLSNPVYDEKIIKHPYKAEERKALSAIPAMNQKTYQSILESQSKDKKREKRESLRCTLDECQKKLSDVRYAIQWLKDNVTWCENEITWFKDSIMTHLRWVSLN